MSESSTPRIWINPWKYWSATARLSGEQIDALMEHVVAESEAGNKDELGKIDFVCLENPYLAWRRERQSRFPHPRVLSSRGE